MEGRFQRGAPVDRARRYHQWPHTPEPVEVLAVIPMGRSLRLSAGSRAEFTEPITKRGFISRTFCEFVMAFARRLRFTRYEHQPTTAVRRGRS